MKLFKRILFWLLILVLFFLVIAYFLPKTVHVERSATINAKPAVVYALLNNLKTYDKWMPWNQIDPKWKVQYSDTTEGAGAWYKWESENRSVGKGKLIITENVPGQKVMTRLEFEGSDPAVSAWELSDKNGNTEIKWWMDANMGSNPVARWMGVLAMDKMIGTEFDKGLANLKKIAGNDSTAK